MSPLMNHMPECLGLFTLTRNFLSSIGSSGGDCDGSNGSLVVVGARAPYLP
jgi:hypothetical protein